MTSHSEPELWIVVPKWGEYQHYKNRDIHWIKNYLDLLHNDAYLELTGHQRGVLHGIWMLYASAHGQLRENTATITRQLNVRVTRATLESLYHAGFLQVSASKPLALTRSREEEKNKKKNARARAREDDAPRPRVSEERVHCPECQLELLRLRLADHLRNVHAVSTE